MNTESDPQLSRAVYDPELEKYLNERHFEAEPIQSVFSFGSQFHTWWFVGTGKPIPTPCERGCTACGPYWN